MFFNISKFWHLIGITENNQIKITIMKNISTKESSNFDLELLNILKNDIQEQRSKVKSKFIAMATRAYDSDLLNIIKSDLAFIKSQFCNPAQTLAKAS